MASRSEHDPNQHDRAPRKRIRVLCVDADPSSRTRIAEILGGRPVSLHSVADAKAARSALKTREYDVLLVDAGKHADGFALAHEVSRAKARTRAIVLCNRPTVALSIRAMRAGAIDILRKPIDADELADRIAAAAEQAETLRAQARRIERLTRICKRLKDSKREVAEQVGVLCNDLANAYQELADHMGPPSVTTEFANRIRAELDIETILRMTLEFVLKHAGSTNAAIFLPTGHSDYSLGAYVNYDLPKDAADVLLDHLADRLPTHFEHDERICHFTEGHHFEAVMDEPIDWLDHSTVIVASCHARSECLGVVALFRDQQRPFPTELLATLESVREIFADQLARVVRIHNRHKGQEVWPGFEIDSDDHDEFDNGYNFGDPTAGDDYGLAA